MSTKYIVVILVLVAAISAQASGPGNCVTCHQDFEDDDGPSHMFVRDIHSQKGLSCVDCHGGDPTLEDMDEVRDLASFRGVPDYLEVPEFCARCHSDAAYMHEHNPSLPVDQLAKYRTSLHGQRLFGDKDTKVANCISCHSVHEIGSGKMPHSTTHPANLPFTCGKCHSDAEHMAGYGIPTNQLELYRGSVHGKALLEKNDLGAPACNDCHGNHGAAPPGVSSLAAVCGTCHAIEAQLFSGSPHAEAFAENDFPMCETCHSNHDIQKPSDQMIGSSEPALCIECHSIDDGTTGFVTADSVLTLVNSLVKARDEAAEVLSDASAKGMMTTDEDFLMKEVDQSLIQSRVLIHSFDVAAVTPEAVAGLAKTDSVKVHSAALIDEYHFRRKGLVVATLIISLLAFLLYRKIRSLN